MNTIRSDGARVAFLIGTGRSGTTLLYKILSLFPDIGFISNYDVSFPAWVPSPLLARATSPLVRIKRWSWFGDNGNAYLSDRSLLKRLVPTPTEGELIYSECGVPLVYRPGYAVSPEVATSLRTRFATMARLSGSSVFISKRTANNWRLRWIRDIFPDALFIHLVRDGRAVAHSLSKVSWWQDHRTGWDGRTPRQLAEAGEKPLAICARNWVREMQAIQDGIRGLPNERLLELRYETLMEDPVRQLQRIASFLDIDSGDPAGLVGALGIRPRQERWTTTWSESEYRTVLHEQLPLLQELGYAIEIPA